MSLKDKCMLVSLSIGKPQMTAKDKQATTEVAVDKHATEDVVAVTKKLYPKHMLKPILHAETAARSYLKSVTEPRGPGLGVLPSKLFMEFHPKMGEFRVGFFQAVTVFLNNYSSVLAIAQSQQGSMFEHNTYPDVSQLRSEFSFDVLYPSLESAGNITLQMEAEGLAVYRKEIEAQTNANQSARQKMLFGRLGEAVKRISVQCGKEDGKIYDTLTSNLDDMLRILPALNFDDDPVFNAVCVDARKLLVAPQAIRTVPEVRQTVASTADEILAKMAAAGFA